MKPTYEELEKLVAELKGALEFYADVSSWSITEGHELRTMGEDDMEIADEPTPWGAKATYIAGKRARETLGRLKGV